MDFALTDEQQQIRDEVLKLCARFDDAYWLDDDLPHVRRWAAARYSTASLRATPA